MTVKGNDMAHVDLKSYKAKSHQIFFTCLSVQMENESRKAEEAE